MRIFVSLAAAALLFESILSWGVFAHAVREGHIAGMVATAILGIICALLSAALAWDAFTNPEGNPSE